MKFEVYYNMMGVMPVSNFFSDREKAVAFMEKVKEKGFSPELIEH